MTIPKVMGTETEYGIFVPDEDPDDNFRLQIYAKEIVENATDNLEKTFKRDFGDIDIDIDSLPASKRKKKRRKRNSPLDSILGKLNDWEYSSRSREILDRDQIRGRTGHVLRNGARFYVDMSHPEFSTPECLTPRELVIWEKAGERIVEFGRKKTQQSSGTRIDIHKNNSDGKGSSYACHENYLLEPETFLNIVLGGLLSFQLETFLVTRQIFTGSGKVGAELSPWVPYQISQRADFIVSRLNPETCRYRPIINSRNIPYADKNKYRRLHVICGDSNMAEFSIYLKLGTTAIVLKMLENNFITQENSVLINPLAFPVVSFHKVSRDLTCQKSLALSNGIEVSAVELQQEFLNLARKFFSEREEPDPVTLDILRKWQFVLDKLLQDPDSLDRYIDWVIKKRFLASYTEKHGLSWKDKNQLKMLDISYHDINPERSIYHVLKKRGRIERIVSEEEIENALQNPPTTTRAFLRGMCVDKFFDDIKNIGWDYIYFQKLPRLEPLDPLKGTKEDCESVLEKTNSPADFVKILKKQGCLPT